MTLLTRKSPRLARLWPAKDIKSPSAPSSHAQGDPNAGLPFWKQWRQEQEDITLAAIDEEISSPVKQAILAECARKVSAVKAYFAKKITDSEQQWHDLQTLLTEAEQTRQQLQTEITQMQHQKIEQQTQQKLADQRLTDTENRLRDIKTRYQAAMLAQERISTEKQMTEKQAADWQIRWQHSEEALKTLQTAQHQYEIEIATLKTRINEREKQEAAYNTSPL